MPVLPSGFLLELSTCCDTNVTQSSSRRSNSGHVRHWWPHVSATLVTFPTPCRRSIQGHLGHTSGAVTFLLSPPPATRTTPLPGRSRREPAPLRTAQPTGRSEQPFRRHGSGHRAGHDDPVREYAYDSGRQGRGSSLVALGSPTGRGMQHLGGPVELTLEWSSPANSVAAAMSTSGTHGAWCRRWPPRAAERRGPRFPRRSGARNRPRRERRLGERGPGRSSADLVQ